MDSTDEMAATNLPFGSSPGSARKNYGNNGHFNGSEDGFKCGSKEETKNMIMQLAGFSNRLEAVLLALLRDQVSFRSNFTL